MYDNGRAEEEPWQHAAAVRRAAALMADPAVHAVFEAAFEHDGPIYGWQSNRPSGDLWICCLSSAVRCACRRFRLVTRSSLLLRRCLPDSVLPISRVLPTAWRLQRLSFSALPTPSRMQAKSFNSGRHCWPAASGIRWPWLKCIARSFGSAARFKQRPGRARPHLTP